MKNKKSTDDAKLLDRFPKRRPELPIAFKRIFESEYLSNREKGNYASKVAIWLERWMHKQASRGSSEFPLLELGAGTLNHLAWEESHGQYDIVEPFEFLYRDNIDGKKRLSSIYRDIEDVPSVRKYKRIISIATFEHVLDLPSLLEKTRTLLEHGSELRIGIPTEGSMLWYLAWRLGTGVSFKLRTGLDYGILMRSEHVNNESEIISLTKMYFDDVKVRRYPLPLKHFSLYTSIVAKNSKTKVAVENKSSAPTIVSGRSD